MQVTFKNLQNGINYELYSNVQGSKSGEGKKSEKIIVTPSTVPDSPQKPIVKALDSKVEISWNLRSDGGSKILRYSLLLGETQGNW